jgi:hypothetical protein
MDVAMLTAAMAGGRAFDSKRLSAQMIGRWTAGLLRGRYRRQDISAYAATGMWLLLMGVRSPSE